MGLGTYTKEAWHVREWHMHIWISRIHMRHVTSVLYVVTYPRWCTLVDRPVYMRHVIYMNESWWCMSYIWMSHGEAHLFTSQYKRVISHVWMGRGTYLNESCHVYKWVMTLMYECMKIMYENESWHLSHESWMSHECMKIMYENESWHLCMNHVTRVPYVFTYSQRGYILSVHQWEDVTT